MRLLRKDYREYLRSLDPDIRRTHQLFDRMELSLFFGSGLTILSVIITGLI
jgi:hypothetical protein